jgi:AraC-like DNA-binding protein
MNATKKKVRYPENIALRGKVAVSGRTIKELAEKIGCSRKLLSELVNGHYKGSRLKTLLEQELNNAATDQDQLSEDQIN